MNLLRHVSSRIAICCVVALGHSIATNDAAGQTNLRGPADPIPAAKNRHNQSSWRAATFLNKLVPLSKNTPNAPAERPEFMFAPEADTQHNGAVDAPLQRPLNRLIPAINVSQQTSEPAYRRQFPSINLDPNDLESLPSPFSGIDEDDENVIIQRFPNGSPQVIRHVAQDENGNYYNDGPWEARNQAGQIVAQGTYVRGMMDGQWSRIHEARSSSLFATKPFNLFQGPYRSVAQFKDGKLDGLWTIYDQYRTKIFEIPYKQGLRHGTATWFYPNTGKLREATFKRGLLDGEILEFDEAEKIAKRQQYVDGRPIVRNTTFYRPNVKKTEDYFLGKKLEPEAVDDWWTAKPAPYVEIGSETKHGSAMSWYENGQPRKRGQFTNGQPVGQFVWWHPNGNKQAEGFYVDGRKNRHWTWWYENGMKQFEGEFKDDKPVNHWRAWHEDGELRKEKDYSPEPDSGAVENPSEVSQSNSSTRAGKTPVEIIPEIINPNANPQSPGEPAVNAPANEKLPAPRTDEPSELETITPLEFRTPTTPDDPTAEEKTGASPEEVGTIPIELFELPIESSANEGDESKSVFKDNRARFDHVNDRSSACFCSVAGYLAS